MTATTRKMMSNGPPPPIAETEDYGVYVMEIQSTTAADGRDLVYAVVNKKHGVVEGRHHLLPAMLEFVQELQANLDKVIGEKRAKH